MNFKLITPILILLITSNCFAQFNFKRAKVTMGESFSASKKSQLSDIIANDESGVYVLKKKYSWLKANDITIEHFDHGMNRTKSVKVKLDKDSSLEFFIHLNNKIYIFYSKRLKKQKKSILMVDTIDKQSLLRNNKTKVISELFDLDRSGISFVASSFDDWFKGDFHFRVSRDSSKVLICYNYVDRKGDPEKIMLKVFDNSLKAIWEKNVTLPFKNNMFEMLDVKLSNKGNVYLLGKSINDLNRIIGNSNKDVVFRKANYKFNIYGISEDLAKPIKHEINHEGKFLGEMKIEIDDNEDIICAGFYSLSPKGYYSNSIKGSYFISIDGKTRGVKKESYKEISLASMIEGASDRQAKKAVRKNKKGKDVELYSYNFNELVLKEEGGAILIGEQFYVTSRTSTDPSTGATSIVNYYHYHNIVVVNIGKGGDILWTKQIRKRQNSANDYGKYSSFSVAIIGDKMHFIFNDDERNLILNKGERVNNFSLRKSRGIVAMVTLDSNGKVIKEQVFGNRQIGVLIVPKVSGQVSDNEVVLFGQKKKSQRFIKLTFKEDI